MSTLTIVFVFFMAVSGLACLYFFGNVDRNHDRHPLQNMVFRLYQWHALLGSLLRALDCAVLGFLKARQEITIKPLNEKNPSLYPAKIIHPLPLPALPPASIVETEEEEVTPRPARPRNSKRPRRLRVAGME